MNAGLEPDGGTYNEETVEEMQEVHSIQKHRIRSPCGFGVWIELMFTAKHDRKFVSVSYQ